MPALRLIHCSPAPTTWPGTLQRDAHLWWTVWCKPVELTLLAWSLPLHLMETPSAHAAIAVGGDALPWPEAAAPWPHAGRPRPHIYLVGGTDVARPDGAAPPAL